MRTVDLIPVCRPKGKVRIQLSPGTPYRFYPPGGSTPHTLAEALKHPTTRNTTH